MATITSYPVKYTQNVFKSQQDQLLAMCLTTLQRQQVENLLFTAVEEKVNMSAEEPYYLIKQEFLRGQISILQYILACDDGARTPETSNT